MKFIKSRSAISVFAIVSVALLIAWIALNEQSAEEDNNTITDVYAACLNRKQEPSAIIEICTRMIEASVSSKKTLAALHVHRGYALDRIDKWTPAIADFDRAIDLEPKNFQAWQGKSFALDGLGEDIAALEAIEVSLSLEPTKRYSANRKFRLLTKLERYEEADEYYSSLMDLYPAEQDSRRFWIPQELGQMRLALGQVEAAAEVLRIAVLSKPSEQKSRQLFFRSCIELGQDCPLLAINSNGAIATQACLATADQVAEQYPKFWSGLRPQEREADEDRELKANEARLRLIEAAYVSYSVGLQLGESKDVNAEGFLLFEDLLGCVEDGELFNPVEKNELSEEIEKFHGGAIRKNMIDIAHLLSNVNR